MTQTEAQMGALTVTHLKTPAQQQAGRPLPPLPLAPRSPPQSAPRSPPHERHRLAPVQQNQQGQRQQRQPSPSPASSASATTSTPQQQQPAEGKNRGSTSPLRKQWEIVTAALATAQAALASPGPGSGTFKPGRRASGNGATGVQQRRAPPGTYVGRRLKDCKLAEDAVDDALDLYRTRMNPREAHDVYDLPTILAELHPEAIKTACHEYMENVVHVGDVQIVTEKYRELKGLCEEEFNILSARAATEARTAAARAQRLVAAMGGKGLGTGPTFRRPSVSVSGVLDSPGPNGRRVSFGGSALDGPLFKEPDARPEFVPDSPSPTRPLLLGALDEDSVVPSRTPSTSGRATGRHAAPSSHAAYHGDGELRLPMIDRGMLNPGTRRFIDEDAPSLASSSALLGALTHVKACHGGAQRPGLLDTFSTQTSPTMAKAHDVATCVGRMGREGGRSQSDFGHSGMGAGTGMGYQGTFLAPRPSALMSIWYPEAGTAPANHDNRAAVTALLREEGGEKLAALVSSWDKAAAAKPPQRGVFKELTGGGESVVRLGR